MFLQFSRVRQLQLRRNKCQQKKCHHQGERGKNTAGGSWATTQRSGHIPWGTPKAHCLQGKEKVKHFSPRAWVSLLYCLYTYCMLWTML